MGVKDDLIKNLTEKYGKPTLGDSTFYIDTENEVWKTDRSVIILEVSDILCGDIFIHYISRREFESYLSERKQKAKSRKDL
jgi:hypothetical protein